MYQNNPSPILPIGLVNLFSGANRLFGNVFFGWEENSGTYLLVQDQSTGKYRAVITADDIESVKTYHSVGQRMYFCHDQTRAQIGNDWVIVGLYPNTKQGLRDMAAKSSKKSLPFATFK